MALAKAAVVVGVSHMPGLGFAISKRFAQGGLKVGIIGRSKERLDAVKAEIEATVPGSEVACAVADASDAAAVKAAFADLAKKHGSPEVLYSIFVLSQLRATCYPLQTHPCNRLHLRAPISCHHP